MRNAAVLGLLLLVVGSLCLSVSAEKKILVLYGQGSIKETHGQFFKGLEAKGHTVDIKSVKDSSLKLKDYDTWLYDALVLFAPKAASEWGECSNQLQISGSQLPVATAMKSSFHHSAAAMYLNFHVYQGRSSSENHSECALQALPPHSVSAGVPAPAVCLHSHSSLLLLCPFVNIFVPQALVATSPARASLTLLTVAST